MIAMFLHLMLYTRWKLRYQSNFESDSIADATSINTIQKVILYGDRAVVHRNHTKTLSVRRIP